MTGGDTGVLVVGVPAVEDKEGLTGAAAPGGRAANIRCFSLLGEATGGEMSSMAEL